MQGTLPNQVWKIWRIKINNDHKPLNEIRFNESMLINKEMGMGEGKLFLTGECQPINVGGG